MGSAGEGELDGCVEWHVWNATRDAIVENVTSLV